MATKARNLLIAEEAYAAIDEMDKVAYIQHIKVGHQSKFNIVKHFTGIKFYHLETFM